MILESKTTVGNAAARITLDQVPDEGQVLFVNSPSSGCNPQGCAASWTLVAPSINGYLGIGPFTGNVVTGAPGRTPPALEFTVERVG